MSDIKPKIEPRATDAVNFIASINKIISSLIDSYRFDDVFMIRIDNWFDHKWLNYSGKSVVQFQDSQLIESALQDEWREKITVPPFNPNRVLSEMFFGINSSVGTDKTLHTVKASNDNIHNRIINFSTNGLFIWYSSETERNQKGSVMIYKVQQGKVETFYVSFENNKHWKAKQVKGITTTELTNLLDFSK